jgi:hypothetical protein
MVNADLFSHRRESFGPGLKIFIGPVDVVEGFPDAVVVYQCTPIPMYSTWSANPGPSL